MATRVMHPKVIIVSEYCTVLGFSATANMLTVMVRYVWFMAILRAEQE